MTSTIRPFEQGNLDGLCGVYAIVNAVRCLCPELDRPASHDLFNALIAELPNLVDEPLAAVTWGIELATMRGLLDAACAYVALNFELEVTVRKLPGRKSITTTTDGLWRALAKTLRPSRVAIITAYGGHDHWTVATKVTERSIGLFDSVQLKFLLRSHCSVGRPRKRHQLRPDEIIIVERLAPAD